MRRPRFRLLALAAAAGLLLGLAGCGTAPGKSQAEPPFVLTVAIPREGVTLDPAAAVTYAGQMAVLQTSRGLFSMTGGQVSYALCEEYTVTDDGLRYTFRLRPDALWSDGSPITAQDFVRGIARGVAPGSGADHLDFALENLAGAKEVHQGLPGRLGVRAVNDTTLEILLRQPCAYFPQLLSFPLFHPLAEGDEQARTRFSGAFQPEDPTQNLLEESRLTLVRNPYFYDASKVALDRLELALSDSGETQVEKYREGSWQAATLLPEEAVLQYAYRNDLQRVQTLESIALVLEESPFFEEEGVRRALALSLDRQALCSGLGLGERPLYALVPSGIGNPATGIDFREEGGRLAAEDPLASRQLLADVGYPEGKGFPPITYFHGESKRALAVARQVQKLWQEQLGIKVTLYPASQREELGDLDGPVVSDRLFAFDYGQPLLYLEPFAGWSDQPTGFSSEDFDGLLREGMGEPDLGRQLERYHQAEKLLCKSSWVLPLCRWGRPVLVREEVIGFTGQLSGLLDFTYTVPAR